MHGPLHFRHVIASPWGYISSSPSRLVGYAIAAIFTLIAFALTLIFMPLIQPHFYAIFYGAVIIAAWYSGPGAALVASILSVLAAEVLFQLPSFPATARPTGWVETSVFVVVSLSIAAITVLRSRAEQQLDALLEREQAARAAAEQSADWVGRLQGATAALSAAMTANEAAYIILNQLSSALGMTDGEVLLLDAAGSELRLVQSIGYPDKPGKEFSAIPVNGPLPAAETVRTGRSIHVRSREELAHRYPELVPDTTGGDCAWLSLPLIIGGAVQGVIVLSFEAPRALSLDEEELALAFAVECGQAIERARLYEQAQKAIQVRDQFFHVASHELKTPLTTLMGYTELLQRRAEGQESNLDDKSRRIVDTILNQTQRLNRMITTLLDASRIDSGQLRLERNRFNLAVLVRALVDEQQLALRRHRIEVKGADQSLIVNGDELRIEQVVQNLLQNAVKYSPDGGTIHVTVAQDKGMATVAVQDHGIGIPAKEIPNIFGRFYRAENAEKKNITGMGIGLHVAHEIVELHGGTITVESRENEGSTFTLSLPLWEE